MRLFSPNATTTGKIEFTCLYILQVSNDYKFYAEYSALSMFFRSWWLVHAEWISTHCDNRSILSILLFPLTLRATISVELKKLRLMCNSCERVTLNLRYGLLKRKAFIITSYVHFHQLIW